jgi:CRP-like cAMP-binding protein
MKEILTIAAQCPLFADIAPQDLQAMLSCLGAKTEHFAKNQTVLREGDAARWVCVVLSGCIRIEQTDWFGTRSILGQAEAGELFGESFACAGVEKLPVQAVAVQQSQVLFLDCTRILYACSNACAFHRTLIFNLMRVLAGKNLRFHSKLEITAQRTTRGKLMAYLAHEAKLQGSSAITIPFDRQALADYLQVDRSGLSVEIGKLKKEGRIECEKNRFTLKEMMP